MPILLMPVVEALRGHSPGSAVVVPVGALLVALLGVLVSLLRRDLDLPPAG